MQEKLSPVRKYFLYDVKMQIKEWIASARKDACITQDQLAEALGLTRGNVSAWENGRHEPNLSQIRKISVICKAKIQELFQDLDGTWPTWPFSVDYKLFENLPDDQKSEVDSYISYIFDKWQSTNAKETLSSSKSSGKTSALDRNSFLIDDQGNQQKKTG